MGLEQQRKEVETIRERSLTIKLSDADCERIFNLCGKHNITVACLLENFIGDLVGGTYTNGSDERDFAGKYFERCWFGRYPETTLLNWLLNMGYDIYDDFLDIIDNIESGYAELEDYWKDPSVFDEEEIEFLKNKNRKSIHSNIKYNKIHVNKISLSFWRIVTFFCQL